ncbi:MAG: Gfo/Idh/MocA family oxidoreductase [Sedimentisphaerales bacterium]|nr:Gfo/Idh/MocA family oxidoreductase [Sedimentisphaerales bacterium]
MSAGRLKTAVLGLSDRGGLLLEAAQGVESLEITAVADKETNLAEKAAAEAQCDSFDDYRQLIIQNQLDCLLVAAPMHSCDEYVRMAMKNRFHVLKMAPTARDFEEATKFVRLADEQEIQFAIANPNRFAQSFLALRRFLQEGKIEQIFLMNVFCNAGDYERSGWQTDPKLAGGGVLLQDCYRIVDQVVWNFGVPQQVYSLSTNQARDKQQRSYLTEDTAVLTMKFSDTFIGNFVAVRREGTGPEEVFLRLYGKDRILTLSGKRVTLSDGSGRVVEELECDDDERECYRQSLERFAESILSPGEKKLASSGRENLKNMAVIESAYLSTRTGFPEEPGRILQMAPMPTGVTPTE